MQFESFSDFLNMGGYAFYVWFAFGVSAGLLAILSIATKLSHSNIKKSIAAQMKREQKLKHAAEMQKAAQEVSNES